MYLPLHIGLSLTSDYLTISLLEYVSHRWFMHRPQLAKLTGSAYLDATWKEHMHHHGQCYDIFDYEEGPCGLLNLTLKHSTELLVSLVPCVLIWFVDPLTAYLLPAMALLHGVLWSAVHAEMHRPQKTWFSKTRLFKDLHRYHFLHHRHMGTNFNTLFLGWDWILRTAAKATEEDRREIQDRTYRVRPKRVAPDRLLRSQITRVLRGD
jgi:hypothetical protein